MVRLISCEKLERPATISSFANSLGSGQLNLARSPRLACDVAQPSDSMGHCGHYKHNYEVTIE